jgi:hypothetical protein
LQGLDRKTVFTGFNIRQKVDIRWVWDQPKVEHFAAPIFTDDSIMVGLPAMDYDHYMHLDSFSEDYISASVENDMDEAHNAYHKIPKESRKHWVLLQFPPLKGWNGIRLSCKEIFRNPDYTDEAKLEIETFPVKSYHKDTKRTSVNWFVQWKWLLMMMEAVSSIAEVNLMRKSRGLQLLTWLPNMTISTEIMSRKLCRRREKKKMSESMLKKVNVILESMKVSLQSL